MMMLADVKGRMLYEVAPDLFPEGLVSEIEIMLWDRYYGEKQERLANG